MINNALPFLVLKQGIYNRFYGAKAKLAYNTGFVFIDGYSSRGTIWKVYDHLQNKGSKNQIR